jgi:hypothetical protein
MTGKVKVSFILVAVFTTKTELTFVFLPLFLNISLLIGKLALCMTHTPPDTLIELAVLISSIKVKRKLYEVPWYSTTQQ